MLIIDGWCNVDGWCKEVARILGYKISKMSPTSTVGNTSVPYYNIFNDHNITTFHTKEEIKKYLELKLRDSVEDDSKKMQELNHIVWIKQNLIDAIVDFDIYLVERRPTSDEEDEFMEMGAVNDGT